MSTLGQLSVPELQFPQQDQAAAVLQPGRRITAEELGHVELVSNGVAMLNNGPDMPDGDEVGPADITDAPFEAMKDIRLAAGFLSHGGGATPVNSNGLSWNNDFVTTTGNVIFDLLHNFHLECGARLHKLRVYETLTDPTGREVCGYLLVRGSVHAHAYALALKKITGVEIEKMLPTPEHPARQHPRMPEVPGRGLAPPPLHVQPRRLRGDRRHLGQWRDGAAGTIRRASSRWSRACRTAARSTT